MQATLLLPWALLPILLTITPTKAGPAFLKDNTLIKESLQGSENTLQGSTTVYSASCSCVAGDTPCKLSPPKSSNTTCLEKEKYCCDGGGLDGAPVDKDLKHEDKGNKSTIRIRVRIPSEDLRTQYEKIKKKVELKKRKPQIRCDCKSRETCEEKHVDYTFGFQCSYDEVRCCEPQNQTEEPIMRVDEGPITSDDQTSTDRIKSECGCLTVSECRRLKLQGVRAGENSACPSGQLLCCRIGDTRMSETDTELRPESEDLMSPWDASEEYEEEFQSGVHLHGQPAYRQPVQLYFPKVPMSERRAEVNPHEASVPDPENLLGQAEVIHSPPQLPNSYYEGSPTLDASANFYEQHGPNRHGPNRPPIYQYFGNVGPHMQQNPPPFPHRIIHVNTQPGSNGRSSSANPSGSFLDAITNFFFG